MSNDEPTPTPSPTSCSSSQRDVLLERDTVLDSYLWLRLRGPDLAVQYLQFWCRNPLIERDFEQILQGEAEWFQIRDLEFQDTYGEGEVRPETPAIPRPVRDLWGKGAEITLPPVDEWRREP